MNIICNVKVQLICNTHALVCISSFKNPYVVEDITCRQVAWFDKRLDDAVKAGTQNAKVHPIGLQTGHQDPDVVEREAGEVDPPTERDRKCADETGDPVAPDLGVGEDLKDSSVVCSPINEILHE